MDEPLSNLDAKLRAQTRLELVALHERVATTFLYVTHDQVEAMTMATRIAVMSEGRLQQVGPPQAVYERPHNLFVARFIGSPPMNTIAGVVRRSTRARRSCRSATGASPSPRSGASRSSTGPRSSSGVRPEHLHAHRRGPGLGGRDRASGEWLGHERHVICDVGGTNVVVRQPSEGTPPTVGDGVRLSAAPAEVHLFSPDTTERLN